MFCVGCTKDDMINSEAKITQQESKKNINAYLSLNSSEDLHSILSGSPHQSRAIIENEDEFISITERVGNLDPSVMDEVLFDIEDHPCDIPPGELTFYDMLGYDTLVPNKELAKLINIKGEIKVGRYIYRITKDGTYYYEAKDQAIVNERIEDLSTLAQECKANDIDESELLNGVFFYNTFKDAPLLFEDSTSFNYPDLNGYELGESTIVVSDKPVQSEAGKWLPPYSPSVFLDIPNINNFPEYNAAGKTIAGKWLASMFGGNSDYKVKLSSNRRLKGKLYYYHYVFYMEIGGYAEMQKKNWIGWSGTRADELILGWRNVILELDLKMPKDPFPFGARPVFNNVDYANIPGFNKKGYCMTIFGLDLNDKQLTAAVKLGAKPTLQYLKSLIPNSADMPSGHIDAIVAINKDKVEILVIDQIDRNYNQEKLRKVFASSVQFMFSINLINMPTSYLSWSKAFKNINGAPVKSLKKGELIVAGRLDSQWAGMKINKN